MKYFFLLSLIFSFSYSSYAAPDHLKGRKLFRKKACATCHGKRGMGKAKLKEGKLKLKITAGPRIAGLNEKYILEQLLAIQGKDKKKVRKTKFTKSMRTRIKKLSKEDFQNLAAYVSKKINPSAGKTKGLVKNK